MEFDELMAVGKNAFVTADFNTAAEYGVEGHKLRPQDPDPLELAAKAYQAMENYKEAIFYFQKAVQCDIENGDRYVELGVAYGSNGDTMKALEAFHTIHNYIDTGERILRKGAIAAHEGERVLIPINMRDGSVIAIGKGNPEWNYSAPHGAGRLMSRTQAKNSLSLEEYRKTMEGVYTTSVNENTLDEAPMAYKSLGDIIDVIKESVDVIDVMKPIYNFKASD